MTHGATLVLNQCGGCVRKVQKVLRDRKWTGVASGMQIAAATVVARMAVVNERDINAGLRGK